VPKTFDEVKALVSADYVREKDAEATKRAAEEAAKRIAAGEKFEAVAAALSDVPSGKNGGSLGTFEVNANAPSDPARRTALRNEVMANDWSFIPELKEVVFALPVGKPSELVKSPLGHHVFLVTERAKGAVSPFEEVRDRIRDIFVEKSKVNEKEITDYYDQNADDYKVPAKIQVKSILAPTEAEAVALRKRIVDGGEAFEDVAKKHSADPSTKDKGGDSGLVVEESFDQALRDALAKVPAGKVSEPVKVQNGFVIAQAVKREVRAPLADVRRRSSTASSDRRSRSSRSIVETRNAAGSSGRPRTRLLEKRMRAGPSPGNLRAGRP
jgi:parvulin-like peptidyl-prolyl isomerase